MKIIPTYTIADDQGHWIDTCLTKEDAITSAIDKGLLKEEAPRTNVITNFLIRFMRKL